MPTWNPAFLGAGASGLQRTCMFLSPLRPQEETAWKKPLPPQPGKGLFTQGLKSGCKAPCRGICRPELRQDTQKQMWRAGNTLFFKAPPEWISRHIALADRVVFHEQPMP